MILGVNVNYIASLRNAIGGAEPDLVRSSRLCEYAGADATVVYYDGFDFNVTKSDILALRRALKKKFVMMVEMNEKTQKLVSEVKPDIVYIVPEKLGYNDVKIGYDVEKSVEKVNEYIVPLIYEGINTGIFVEPDFAQVTAAYKSGVQWVEINAKKFSENFPSKENGQEEFIRFKEAAVYADTLGLNVSVSGGINYKNIALVKTIPTVKEVNIGHSIITRAIFDGLSSAVKQMAEELKK